MPDPASPVHESAFGFKVWRAEVRGSMKAPHTHPDIELNYVKKGHLVYLHGGKLHQIEPGHSAILWGGIPHQAMKSPQVVEGIWMTIPLAWFLQWKLPNNLTHQLLLGDVILGKEAEGAKFELWLADYLSKEGERRKVLCLELEASLHRLALAGPRSEVADETQEGIWKIETVTRFIAENYREHLSVEQIAAAVGLHPRYLMRSFKSQTKLTLWEYLTRLRISHAQRLLMTTDLKIVDVALESGFGSVAPFYAAFAEQNQGVSPVRFRQKNRIGSK